MGHFRAPTQPFRRPSPKTLFPSRLSSRSDEATESQQRLYRHRETQARLADARTQVAMSEAASNRAGAIDWAYAPESMPEWGAKADPSHDLLWVGGFLFCPKCGMKAAFVIQYSKLRFPCSPSLSKDGRRVVKALLSGSLPPGYKEWPDQGAAIRDGAQVRRVRYPCTVIHPRPPQ